MAARAGIPNPARRLVLGNAGWASGLLAAAVLACVPAAAQSPSSKAPPGSLALPTPSVVQQAPAQATVEQRLAYEAAFKATLDKPSDPETLAQFARLAVQIGDIEGAISSLERLLLIERDQPEVKLELGVLYYRIGARDAAAMYLDSARASPGASLETRERAEAFLKAAGR